MAKGPRERAPSATVQSCVISRTARAGCRHSSARRPPRCTSLPGMFRADAVCSVALAEDVEVHHVLVHRESGPVNWTARSRPDGSRRRPLSDRPEPWRHRVWLLTKWYQAPSSPSSHAAPDRDEVAVLRWIPCRRERSSRDREPEERQRAEQKSSAFLPLLSIPQCRTLPGAAHRIVRRSRGVSTAPTHRARCRSYGPSWIGGPLRHVPTRLGTHPPSSRSRGRPRSRCCRGAPPGTSGCRSDLDPEPILTVRDVGHVDALAGKLEVVDVHPTPREPHPDRACRSGCRTPRADRRRSGGASSASLEWS